jgi:beta-glucanase (GH16 family)
MPVASIATPAPSIVAAVVPDSTPAPTSSETIASIDTEAPSFVAAGSSESDVYCYPPSSERKRYTNVWGTCLLEAKDSGDGVCGPSDNAFADELVTLDENDVLTLSFASSNGLWYGSEVRMVQTTAPYTYGTYTYNIKEIRVIDLASGAVVGNTLPAGLVLGMFTWDPAHAEGEEDLYEVDIEVSQWGDSTNADVQFLLQPPEEPHFYRFVSGTNGDLVQAPQTYEFTWLPTSVAWYSTAGGGQNLLYTTEQAVSAGQTDRIQCLPANIEARIALWSTQSAGVDPVGMTTDHKVEVVVDSFVFTPIAVTGVADGEACSKSCQCLSGFCQNGAVCATV